MEIPAHARILVLVGEALESNTLESKSCLAIHYLGNFIQVTELPWACFFISKMIITLGYKAFNPVLPDHVKCSEHYYNLGSVFRSNTGSHFFFSFLFFVEREEGRTGSRFDM